MSNKTKLFLFLNKFREDINKTFGSKTFWSRPLGVEWSPGPQLRTFFASAAKWARRIPSDALRRPDWSGGQNQPGHQPVARLVSEQVRVRRLIKGRYLRFREFEIRIAQPQKPPGPKKPKKTFFTTFFEKGPPSCFCRFKKEIGWGMRLKSPKLGSQAGKEQFAKSGAGGWRFKMKKWLLFDGKMVGKMARLAI